MLVVPRSLRHGVALVLVAITLDARATSVSTPPPDGAGLYLTHCASCHGRSGRGDGPDASFFISPPRNLRDGYLDQHDTKEIVRRIRDGRSPALPFDAVALRARVGEIDALVAHLKSIPDIDWDRAVRGQVLYLERCQPCHGFFGRPDAGTPAGRKPPRDLASGHDRRTLDDGDLLRTMRSGHAHVPEVPALQSDADGRALLAFVRLLSPGFEIYTRYCGMCHGDDGRPQGTPVDPRDRPTVVFDRAYFERHDAGELRLAVWHMLNEHEPEMPHFRADVSETGVRAIVDYLRTMK